MNRKLIEIDNLINSKNQFIRELESTLSKRKKHINELIAENARLCRELEEASQIARTVPEWENLFFRLKAFAEENGLTVSLTNQTDWKAAFENMRDFAMSKGLDISTRG